MLDLYLSDKYKHHWPEIVRLAHLDDAESRKKLRAYALEACRISTQAYGLFRNVAEDCVVEEAGKEYHLKGGESIFVNLVLHQLGYSNVRWVQILILMLSQIHWRLNSIVQRRRTLIMDGVHIIVWEKK